MKYQGFSRIELLAVGAASLIVGGLLLPVLAQNATPPAIICEKCGKDFNFCPSCGAPLNDAAKRAKAAEAEHAEKVKDPKYACATNLKQIAIAIAQYTQDFDEFMPPAASGTRLNNEVYYGWAGITLPYLRSKSLFQCPSEKNAGQENYTLPGYSDYWFNRNLAGANLNDIPSPSQTLATGDGDGGAINSTARYSLNALPKAWPTTPGSPALRHEEMANYGFADGHVKACKPSEVGQRDVRFTLK